MGFGEIIKASSILVASIVVAILCLFGIFWLEDIKEETQKEACITEYKSLFEDEVSIQKQCNAMICNELGLQESRSGSWAKPIIYCQTESGGYIKVYMPQHTSDECSDYFWARWQKAVCLENAGYLGARW